MILRGMIFVVAALVVALGVLAFVQVQSRRAAPKATTGTAAVGAGAPTPPPSTAVSGGSISWQQTMSGALRQAKASRGLIIVDIYTDWCGWCKRMDRDIYAAPAVVALSQKDVFLKYNAEDGGEGESFARKMNVRGYTTTFILDSEGELLQTARGYLDSPQRFVSLVESSRAQ